MNYRPISRSDNSDLVEIKETLSELLDVLRQRDMPAKPSAPSAQPADLLDYARRLLTIRTARRRFLPAGYFESPALTILLDLYVSKGEDRQVAVSDAVAISGAPTSTALRWIATMEADDYVIRRPDPKDRRRTLLKPTARAITDIERLAALWRTTTH